MKPLALALAVLLAAPASALKVEKVRVARPAGVLSGGGEIEAVSGSVLVRFEPTMTKPAREAALALRRMGIIQELAGGGWTHVALPSGMSVASGLAILSGLTGVLEAAPNHVYRPNLTPNDAFFAQQYHLGKINASAAWEYEVGNSTRVTVAVIDAGIEGTHPDLAAKFLGAANSWFCNPGACKSPISGFVDPWECAAPGADDIACAIEAPIKACNHGTRVAGIAAAVTNNGTGVAGASWGANLISMRVFRTADCTDACGDAGGNICATDDTAIINAISSATLLNNKPAYGRIVVNISLGSSGVACSAALQAAINPAVATSTGVIIVVSAGNDGGEVNSPGNCNGVIPVGATDASDNIASFSSRGAQLAANGIVAPGVGLTTTDLNGQVTSGATGTSFSAPLVSGVAALVVAAKPTFSPTNVRDTLRSSTEGIGVASVHGAELVPMGNTAGAGRLNAFRAVKLAVEGTLAGFAGDQKVIAFPNPFRTSQSGSVTITIPTGLQSKGTIIRVYTLDGQLVRDLKAQTTWDGKNDGGNEVASGTYLVLVKTDAGTQTGKVAVIR